MPSPFPGMDPWLEDPEVFPDLHESLIYLLKAGINAVLPPGYVATSKNRVYVEEDRLREPDVALFGHANGFNGGAVATLPGLIAIGHERLSDPVKEPYLEIFSAGGKRLVTAVEIISLTNKKAGERARKTYQNKQQEYRAAGVNIVEIDLLRQGPHVSAVPLNRIQRKVRGAFDYHVSALVAGDPNQFFAAPIKLADRLPAIGIPLDHKAAPVTVDLQPLFDRAYDTGRYPELVDYRKPCDPPLTPDQLAWAECILREKGILR
jgi:hypothetical protein